MFGGMRTRTPERSLALADTRDCLNVHTVNGPIEVRPGFTAFYGPFNASGINPTLRVVAIVQVGAGGETSHIVWFQNRPAGLPPSADFAVWEIGNASSVVNQQIDIGESWHSWRASIAVFAKRIYLIHGSPELSRKIYKHDGAWYAERIGIPKATPAPICVNRPGPHPAGTEMSYRYTGYNNKAHVEGGPSDETIYEITGLPGETGGVIIDTQQTNPQSIDPQCTHIRLYRKFVTHEVTPQYTWFRIAQGTSRYFHDDGSLDTLYDFDTELNLVTEMPPASNHVAVYRRIMWWVNGIGGHEIRYSIEDNPERVSPLNTYSPGNDGDAITALIPAFGQLLIFKRHSIYTITGSSPSSFTCSLLNSTIGCPTEHAIVSIGNALYFLGYDGLYQFSAGAVTRLSNAIAPLLASYPYEATLAHLPRLNLLILSIRDPDTPYDWGVQWAYDLARGNWFKWDMGIHAITSYKHGAFVVSLTGEPGAGRTGHVGSLEGNTDTNDPINWHWRMPGSDYGTTRRKKFFYFSVGLDTDNHLGSTKLAVKGQPDGLVTEGSPLLIDTNAEADPHGKTGRIGWTAETVQFEVGGETRDAVRISSVEIEAEPIERR